MYTIQFINVYTKEQQFFNFTDNLKIGEVLKYVSDYFQRDNIRYYYCSKQINQNDTSFEIKNVHNEIYFV